MNSLVLLLAPIALLFVSNIFMTFAWYGQFKFPNAILWQVVLVSWGIAFFEYCLAVPANRIGHQVYSAAQLKTLQEIITLLVFGVFSVLYLGETLKWNHMVAFLFLCGAAFFFLQQVDLGRAAATLAPGLTGDFHEDFDRHGFGRGFDLAGGGADRARPGALSRPL